MTTLDVSPRAVEPSESVIFVIVFLPVPTLMLMVSNSSVPSPIPITAVEASFLISTLATSEAPTTTSFAKSARISPFDPFKTTFAFA